MNNSGIEIERRYLIEMPDEALLLEKGRSSRIIQTYLLSDKGTERVRKRVDEHSCIYTHTVKQRISELSRREIEQEIDAEEYKVLLSRADPSRRTIDKYRWCISFGKHTLEIDIFSFWDDKAILEIELEAENQEFVIPECFRIIKEISGDGRYTNSSLAREIPVD